MPIPSRLVVDLETHLIQPGAFIPKPVAGSVYIVDELPEGTSHTPDALAEYIPTIARHIINTAATPGKIVVGARVEFDMSVLAVHAPECAPAIWQLYREGRVSDVQVREKLIALRKGYLGAPGLKFNLESLVKKHLDIDIGVDKHGADSWRMRYSELDGVPFEQWPAEAMQYMLNDTKLTHAVWQKQLVEADENGFVPNEQEQVRAAFALQWISAYGLIADPEAVAVLKAKTTEELNKHVQVLLSKGILKNKKGGGYSKDQKTIRDLVEKDYTAQGAEVPRTEKGAVKMDEETLNGTTSPDLSDLKEYNEAASLMSKYVEGVLEPATQRPMHPSFDVLKETGRTSSYGQEVNAAGPWQGQMLGFNCQQLPRKGGVRECFVPRPGYVFVGCDYSYIEICCLAQVLYTGFGQSHMRDALVAGHDPHNVTAAALSGISVEEFNKRIAADDPAAVEMRQFAKIPNFGFPGGLGAATFVAFAKNYGVKITEAEAKQTREGWMSAYPEMADYFRYIGNQCDNPDGVMDVAQLFTTRVRGRAGYTQACNSFFQGLAADGLKEALWLIAEEMYSPESKSALAGSFMVVEAHDEILMESPRQTAHEAATRLQELMVQGMKKFCPDVPINAQPVMMERWYKGAKPVYNAEKRLIPWRPKEK